MSAQNTAMRLSLIEGAFYALMVGCGEIYFLADAVRLGASPLEQGLVIVVPLFAGALGPVVALACLARQVRKKRIVIAAASCQVLVLGLIASAGLYALLTPPLLIALVCLYQVCAQAAGMSWSSWYGDVVPAEIRGRYFARRNRLVHLTTCAALIAAGLALQRLEPGAAGLVAAGAGGLGFAVIFGAAALARAVSVALLARSPEPDARLGASPRAARSLILSRESGALRRLLGAVGLLQLMVYVGSPYFGPYMLTTLKFDYTQYMIGTIAIVLLKFVSLPRWGRAIDRYGARSVYTLAVAAVALIPLPWLWAQGLAWVLVAQGLSGFAWGGHEVAQFSLLLERNESRERPAVFAALVAVSGAAQLVGGLLGGAVLTLAGGDYRVVFAASLLGRLAVAVTMPRLVPSTAGQPGIGRKQLLLRLVGVRPSGGVEGRPMILEDDAEEREEAAARDAAPPS